MPLEKMTKCKDNNDSYHTNTSLHGAYCNLLDVMLHSASNIKYRSDWTSVEVGITFKEQANDIKN